MQLVGTKVRIFALSEFQEKRVSLHRSTRDTFRCKELILLTRFQLHVKWLSTGRVRDVMEVGDFVEDGVFGQIVCKSQLH